MDIFAPEEAETFTSSLLSKMLQLAPLDTSMFISFAQSIAARIQENCFEFLDAPVLTIGAENMPAIPLNEILEMTMLPNSKKLEESIRKILIY